MNRGDGKRLKNTDPMYTVAAFVMDKRYDAMNMITIDLPEGLSGCVGLRTQHAAACFSNLKLVMGKEEAQTPAAGKSEFAAVISEKVMTETNKKKAISVLKILGIIAGAILLIDAVSMIIYFAVNGLPM